MAEQPIIIKKKKVHGGHAHHGGSWKVAYADFVTAMMAFFMVMWIMGLSDQDKAQISGYFNDPMGFNKTLPRSRSVINIKGVPAMRVGTSREPNSDHFKNENSKLKRVANELKKVLTEDPALKDMAKQIEITMTREGLRIEFVESAHIAFFESGSAVLKPEAREMVHHIAPFLSKGDRELMVEGHTDAHAYPGKGYTNWELSSDRANALRRGLCEGGVRYDQFRAVRGLADTELRDKEHPFSPTNRRVSILLPWEDKPKGPEKPENVDLAPKEPGIAPNYEPPAH